MFSYLFWYTYFAMDKHYTKFSLEKHAKMSAGTSSEDGIQNVFEVVWNDGENGKEESHFTIPISTTVAHVSTISAQDAAESVIEGPDTETLIIERKITKKEMQDLETFYIPIDENDLVPANQMKSPRRYRKQEEDNYETPKKTSKYIKREATDKKCSKRFVPSWLNMPQFNPWLEESSVPGMAHCNICKKDLLPGKSELMKHAAGKKHIRRLEAFGTGTKDDILEQRIIDVRSDTVTRPTRDMRIALRDSEVADDCLEEDPTTKKLEAKVAEILEKEDGLFFPTGTMANTAALLTHCIPRGSRVVVGDKSFLYSSLCPSVSCFSSLDIKVVRNLPDGTFDIAELKEIIMGPQLGWVTSTVVCIENTHSILGGKVLPPQWLDTLGSFCMDNGLTLHCDGARLINASVASAIPPANLVKHCNSATFCLNKGLGAPSGSVLVGQTMFIYRASHMRKMLGGSLHQSGILSGAAFYGLVNFTNRINKDHHNARTVAKAISDLNSCSVTVDLNAVQSNIVLLVCDNIRVSPTQLCRRLNEVSQDEARALHNTIYLKAKPQPPVHVRLVFHGDLNSEDILKSIDKLSYVINEYESCFVIECT